MAFVERIEYKPASWGREMSSPADQLSTQGANVGGVTSKLGGLLFFLNFKRDSIQTRSINS